MLLMSVSNSSVSNGFIVHVSNVSNGVSDISIASDVSTVGNLSIVSSVSSINNVIIVKTHFSVRVRLQLFKTTLGFFIWFFSQKKVPPLK